MTNPADPIPLDKMDSRQQRDAALAALPKVQPASGQPAAEPKPTTPDEQERERVRFFRLSPQERLREAALSVLPMVTT